MCAGSGWMMQDLVIEVCECVQEVVGLLLEFGADISTVNSEGHRPRDVTRSEHVIKMLEGTIC